MNAGEMIMFIHNPSSSQSQVKQEGKFKRAQTCFLHTQYRTRLEPCILFKIDNFTQNTTKNKKSHNFHFHPKQFHSAFHSMFIHPNAKSSPSSKSKPNQIIGFFFDMFRIVAFLFKIFVSKGSWFFRRNMEFAKAEGGDDRMNLLPWLNWYPIPSTTP